MLNNLNIFQSSASKEGQNQKDGRRTVADFVKESPRAVYTFDSERDAPEAELCRQPPAGGGRTSCIKVAMASKELFQYMQDLGFYCALPLNPAKTHMECTPMPR